MTSPGRPLHLAAARMRRAARRAEAKRLAAVLRTESVGGILILAAAVAALVVANTGLQHWYESLRDARIGPASLHLDLTVGQWTADGLLAIFFFLAGLELKHEFTVGELADPRRAAVPILAAIGGMTAPAVLYVLISPSDVLSGWAIPTATDIAFALGVLAVAGRYLPAVLRTFLLTLAVVDDLLAIIVIALFYTSDVHLGSLVGALIAIAAFALAIRARRLPRPVVIVVLVCSAVAAWFLMHASGVHATVAGVLLGLSVPILGRRVRRSARHDGADAPRVRRGPAPKVAHRLDSLVRPFSAGFVVPVFAFFAAGVTVGGLSGLREALVAPVTVAIMVGLVGGKIIGIMGTTLIAARLTGSPLMRTISRWDLLGVATVGGIGFTVSLLIGHLAFATNPIYTTEVQIGVLVGSVVAAVTALAILRARNRVYHAAQPRQDDANVADQRR